MNRLDSSLHKFNPDHFGGLDDFLSTADSKERDTLMIACSDQGTAPDNVSFAGTDRFFVLQYIAGCVPRPEDSESFQASIRVGFNRYDLRHAVVCGHLGCNVIRNWLKDRSSGNAINSLQADFYTAAVNAVDTAYPHLTGQAYVNRLVCKHALFQLENLQENRLIREKLDANLLRLHLWIVNDETARILAFNPHTGELFPIEEVR